MYVAPKSVSGRVVKTRRLWSVPSIAKSISAPSLRPIHSRCMALVDAGHSSPSNWSSSLSAYDVIRNAHWLRGLRTTGCPPLSLRPSITSSLASTVPSFGHQFTVVSLRYARRYESISVPRSSSVSSCHRRTPTAVPVMA
jgi:hypothetical protein